MLAILAYRNHAQTVHEFMAPFHFCLFYSLKPFFFPFLFLSSTCHVSLSTLLFNNGKLSEDGDVIVSHRTFFCFVVHVCVSFFFSFLLSSCVVFRKS